MKDLLELYRLAEDHGVPVCWYKMESVESLSCKLEDGSSAIALNPWCTLSVADEKVKLAHELGHCETGSFYNRYSPYDIRAQHERRADRWAIKQLVPRDELMAAFARGRTELWELAEDFNVTEDFIKKAYKYYDDEGNET